MDLTIHLQGQSLLLTKNFETRFSTWIHFSEISWYSATQTSDAVYIIGGRYRKYFGGTKNIVAEFKDNVWRRLADLKQGRDLHGSITVGGQTMIIGGHEKYSG